MKDYYKKQDKAVINLYSNSDQVMNDAIDRIVVDIYNKKRVHEDAHKLLLTGCGPQCGSTSISISLGIAFANAKWKTLIIDCDLRRNRNYKKLNDNAQKGLADFLEVEETESEIKFEDIVYDTNVSSLSYIPCGASESSPARLFCSNIMQDLIKYANENYDYVIFDFPSVSVAPDAQILFGEVDGIILISALETVTKKQIKDAKHKVQPFQDKYYGMIVNKIDMNLYKKYIKRFDYYFKDKNGQQKLGGNVIKQYRRVQKQSVKNDTVVDNADSKKAGKN